MVVGKTPAEFIAGPGIKRRFSVDGKWNIGYVLDIIIRKEYRGNGQRLPGPAAERRDREGGKPLPSLLNRPAYSLPGLSRGFGAISAIRRHLLIIA